jgi:hypothetical protein
LLPRLEFAACYAYSKRGTSEAAKTSVALRDRVKSGSAVWLPRYAGRVHQVYRDEECFRAFFGPDITLVPVPGSAPLVPGAQWIPRRIAELLLAEGLAREVLPCLLRQRAVPKSAYALPGERPDVQLHYDSMRIEPTLVQPPSITLVDDIVTKGRTLLAAASRVAEAFPEAQVRAFALVRYRGLVPDIDRFLDPVAGTIAFDGTDTNRQP